MNSLTPPEASQYHPVPPFGKKTGVLLVNLGTPEAPTAAALRPYLREFLSDPRVVELPRWFWIPLLYGVIVPLRAPKSAHAYAQIWDKTYNQSPLRVITEAQTRALDRMLPKEVSVRYAMRYGKPSIPQVLDEMKAGGCGRIVVMPMYPQYAGATVGTVMDEVARWMMGQRWVPSISFVPPYYDSPLYIEALAESATGYGLRVTGKNAPQVLIASFHGMPLKACEEGDVYYCHCHKTARLLAERLGMRFCKTIEEVVEGNPDEVPAFAGMSNAKASRTAKPKLLLTFQSRFGKAQWLTPYLADVLSALPKRGVVRAQVISPAFAADCVETLEELAIGGREIFMDAGGEDYGVVPCLNDSPEGMGMVGGLVERWI